MEGQKLGKYRLLTKLGAGGQGTVYKATDETLNRTAAVKVLNHDLAVKDKNLQYFHREAQLASALDHPGICTIYDLDSRAGVHFIAMQFIEGKNLRQLVNGRPLELQSALGIAIQIADALEIAHQRGIIHRDIKGGNVMITPAGQVKILDFGLAKLLQSEELATAEVNNSQLTELGVPYGTAAYAAPEQALGEKVDARADIFSTGVLLYEMLSGTLPFRGKTAPRIRAAVISDSPRVLAEVRPGPTSPRLQKILDRALAKEPRQRYQSITELRDALRSELGAVGLPDDFLLGRPATKVQFVRTGLVNRAFQWLKSTTVASTEQQRANTAFQNALTNDPQDDGRKSVAILPFRNLANNPETNFYEFALADAVITELARVRSLTVRPSSVIVKYQGRALDPRDAGRELNVNAVLSAGFISVADRFRVTTQLIDVVSGDILWSDRIDAATGDMITLQDTIAQRITDGLRLELSPDEQAGMARALTSNTDAYEDYLRGRDSLARFNRTGGREDVDNAIDHFQRAIEVDPEFALAHSGLGNSYMNRAQLNVGEAGDYEEAQVAFKRALVLDPQLFEARAQMLFVYLARHEKPKARSEVTKLRREYPNEPVVHFASGVLQRLDGEYDRALRSFERMAILDPASRVVASYNCARILMYQQRWEEALAELDGGAAIEPDHPLILTFRARVLFYRGQVREATAMLEQLLKRVPEMDGIRPILAICFAAQERREEALAQLSGRVSEIAATDHDVAYWFASALAVLGDEERALEWLATAISLGNENYKWFASDPNWKSLHRNPRFEELTSATLTGDNP